MELGAERVRGAKFLPERPRTMPENHEVVVVAEEEEEEAAAEVEEKVDGDEEIFITEIVVCFKWEIGRF